MPFDKALPADRQRVADLLSTGRSAVPKRAVNTFMAVWNAVYDRTQDEGAAYAQAHGVVNRRFPKAEGHAANAAIGAVAKMLAASVGRRTLQELELTLQNCDCGKDHARTLRVLQGALAMASRAAGNPAPGRRHAANAVLGDVFAGAPVRQVGARVDIVWKVFARDIYASGDKVFLAVREMLQNARDARAKNIEITWTPNDPGDPDSDGTLVFQDDGTGMSAETLEQKFLVIGESGEEKQGDTDALGGFGAAKAAILTASRDEWSWEIMTRDVVARSATAGSYQIARLPDGQRLAGTRITLPNVRGGAASTPFGRGLPVPRMVALVSTCDLRGLRVRINGDLVESYFEGRRGRHGDVEEGYESLSWGSIVPSIKSYARPDKEGGAIFIRVKGLAQFGVGPPYGAQFERDWVLDFEIPKGLTPHMPGYPFKAGRDAFRSGTFAWSAFERMVGTLVVRAAQASSDLGEYEEVQPDSSDPRERKAAAQFNNMLDTVLGSDSFQSVLVDLVETSDEMNRAVQAALGGSGVTVLDAAETSHRPAAGDVEARPDAPDAPDPTAPNPLATLIESLVSGDLLEQSTRLRAFVETALPDGDLTEFNRSLDYLRRRDGNALDLQTLSRVLTEALRRSAPQAGSLMIGAAVSRVLRVFEEALSSADREEVRQLKKRGELNPFGDAACIFTHRQRFGAERGKEFRRKARAYMKYLVAWDFVVRAVLTAANASRTNQWYRIDRLGIGFVLDPEVLGLTRKDGKFVMVQPLAFEKVAETYRDRPFVVAAWVHGVACHEIAHAMEIQSEGNGGHNQNWSVVRENLAAETLFLLPAIEDGCAKLLKLRKRRRRRPTPAEVDERVVRLETALAEARTQIEEATASEGKRTRIFDRYAGLAHKLHHLVGLYEFRDWLQANPDAVAEYNVSVSQLLGALDEPDAGSRVVELIEAAEQQDREAHAALARRAGARWSYDAQESREAACGCMGFRGDPVSGAVWGLDAPLSDEDQVGGHSASVKLQRAGVSAFCPTPTGKRVLASGDHTTLPKYEGSSAELSERPASSDWFDADLPKVMKAIRKLGYEPGEELGRGSYARVFDLGDSVLKVTCDSTEAAAAQTIFESGRRCDLPAVVPYQCVWGFDTKWTAYPLFAIVTAKASPLSPEALAVVEHACGSSYEYGTDWAYSVRRIKNNPRYKPLPGAPKFYRRMMKAGEWGERQLRRLVESLHTLDDLGIEWEDLHPGNVMEDEVGNLLIVDIGLNSVQSKRIAAHAALATAQAVEHAACGCGAGASAYGTYLDESEGEHPA